MPAVMALCLTLQLVASGCKPGNLNTVYSGLNYNCSVILQRGNERITITNENALFNGSEDRKFFTCPNDYYDHATYDLNGDGVRNQADAVEDWRRWVHYHLQMARDSEDVTISEQWRGWCEVPGTARCDSEAGRWTDNPPDQEAPPDVPMSVCSEGAGTCIHTAFSSSEPSSTDPIENMTELEWPGEGVCVGAESNQTICLTNCGTEALVITGGGIPLSPQSADFEIVWNECAPETEGGVLRDGFLEAGESCFLQVEFDPQAAGERHADISLNTTHPDLENIDIGLTAQADGGEINVPETAAFYEMPAGGGCTHETRVCITNTGCGQLQISDFEIENNNFELVSDPTETGPVTLPTSGSPPGACGGLELVIRFCSNDPTTLYDNGTLQITSNDLLYHTAEVVLINPGG